MSFRHDTNRRLPYDVEMAQQATEGDVLDKLKRGASLASAVSTVGAARL